MTSAFSRQNSVSLWHASFCTPRPNLPITPGRHEFELTPGVDNGQGCLADCNPWGSNESDMIEQVN